MSGTRIIKEHDNRKTELINAALELFTQKGYEKTSVNDILKKVGVAKGTFYHYFKSKEELLDVMLEILVNPIMDKIDEIIQDKKLNAIEKLNQVMFISRQIKMEHRNIIFAILSIYYRDENIIIRHKMRQKNLMTTIPFYLKIIAMGEKEGLFKVEFPEETAKFLTYISMDIAEENAKLIIELQQNPTNMEKIKRNFMAIEVVIEKLLGLKKGVLKLYEEGFIEKMLNKKNE